MGAMLWVYVIVVIIVVSISIIISVFLVIIGVVSCQHHCDLIPAAVLLYVNNSVILFQH